MTEAVANGQASRASVEDVLAGPPLTEGYRPAVPIHMLEADWLPQIYLFRDVELMLTHQSVRTALEYYKAGVSGAEFYGGPDPADPDNEAGLPISEDPDVARFVHASCHAYWERGVPLAQAGYEYGWLGCEPRYARESGLLLWEGFHQFSPRDTFLLTEENRPVGVRVKGVRGKDDVDLWLGSRDVPAKGFWYAHRPRYSQFYGQSQLFGAWRPWRRLAWKDAAETVIDAGFYRFAYSGPVIRYPEEDTQAAATGAGAPAATAADSQGRSRRPARDVARQMADYAKAGAGYGIPSTCYARDQGGQPKWDIKFPEHSLDGAGLIEYAKYLQDQISYGVGVPPELLQAGETGSGYSGRNIPFEAFVFGQQQVADALLRAFVGQILRPLVRWNFGGVPFGVKVKPLLASKRKLMASAEGKDDPRAGAHVPPDGRPPIQPGAEAPAGLPPDGQGQPQGWAALSLSGEALEGRARAALLQALQSREFAA